MPCPLCSLQRVVFIFIGLFSLAAAFLFRFRWCRLPINFLALFMAMIGILLAGRQVWLQHFPPASTADCSPGLQYMIEALPVNELIQKIFAGTAECAVKTWSLMGINMAEWSMLCFLFLAAIFLLLLVADLFKRHTR